MAHAAVVAAKQMNLGAIAVVSTSGGAARLMSEYRPKATIAAFTSDETIYRRLALHWGVIPIWMRPAVTQEELFEQIEHTLTGRKLASPGDHVIITAAVPIGCGFQTNQMKVHRIGL